MTFTILSESELPSVAGGLLTDFPDRRIFAVYGAMGAGKTTFIKAICRELGVSDQALSPTFSIVNEYRKPDGTPVYHMDLYRIDNLEEIFDIGYEEYLYSGHYCFLEWPERIEPLLPEETVKVRIEGEGERRISYSRPGQHGNPNVSEAFA